MIGAFQLVTHTYSTSLLRWQLLFELPAPMTQAAQAGVRPLSFCHISEEAALAPAALEPAATPPHVCNMANVSDAS